MSFWAIENFDHVNGDVDEDYYFPYANDLAIRSRELLSEKSSRDIFELSNVLATFIQIQSRNIDHEIALSCQSPSDADGLMTSNLYSHYRLLRMFGDERWPAISPLTQIDFKGVLPNDVQTKWYQWEIFAVLVMTMVSAAMLAREAEENDWRELLDGELPFVEDELSDTEKLLEIRERSWRITCELSLGAAGALSHAEHLKQEADKEENELNYRREKALKLNLEKHEETYEAKRRVVQEWEKRISDFPSATKAGLYFHTWVGEQKLKIHEPSTITKWIRDAAKAKGIKWR